MCTSAYLCPSIAETWRRVHDGAAPQQSIDRLEGSPSLIPITCITGPDRNLIRSATSAINQSMLQGFAHAGTQLAPRPASLREGFQ
jgi:hypothetical protein